MEDQDILTIYDETRKGDLKKKKIQLPTGLKSTSKKEAVNLKND